MSQESQSGRGLGGATRRELLLRASALGATAAVGPLLAACGGGESSATTTGAASAGTPQRGGELVWAWQHQPGNIMSPGMSPGYTPGELFPQLQVYNQLLEVFPGSNELRPGLATDWSMSSDGTRYLFKLRDVEFSNGMRLTAQDVVYSLDRYNDDTRNLYAFMISDAYDRARALDPRTVEVRLRKPVGAFLDALAIAPGSILPRQVVERLGERGFEKAPIGTGPFLFGERDKGNSLVLERNPNYWRDGKPHLDRIRFDYVGDSNARILKITSGDANIASSIPYSQIDRIDGTPGLRCLVEPIASLRAVWMSSNCRPLLDRHVRLALNYAAPKEAIAESVYGGRVRVANSNLPPLRYWDESVPPFPYDIERAKEEMAKSSVPEGFELEFMYDAADTEARAAVTILQDSWGQIGVRVKQRQSDVGTVNTKALRGDFDAMLSFDMLSDTTSEDGFASNIYGVRNDYEFGKVPPFVDRYVERRSQEAMDSVDDAERRAIFNELQRYTMSENPPHVPLVFLTERTALKDEVQGFATTSVDYWRLEDVWIQRA
jgi:peptide/nickel transport system substrate-binding protein